MNGSYPRAWGLYIIAWPVTGPSGNGTANPSTLATNLAKAVEEKDGSFFHLCLYPGPNDCSKLGATINVQGQNMGGGSFVHVEANQDVAGDPARREQLAVAIAHTMQ